MLIFCRKVQTFACCREWGGHCFTRHSKVFIWCYCSNGEGSWKGKSHCCCCWRSWKKLGDISLWLVENDTLKNSIQSVIIFFFVLHSIRIHSYFKLLNNVNLFDIQRSFLGNPWVMYWLLTTKLKILAGLFLGREEFHFLLQLLVLYRS